MRYSDLPGLPTGSISNYEDIYAITPRLVDPQDGQQVNVIYYANDGVVPPIAAITLGENADDDIIVRYWLWYNVEVEPTEGGTEWILNDIRYNREVDIRDIDQDEDDRYLVVTCDGLVHEYYLGTDEDTDLFVQQWVYPT